jgi:glycosyltransferase involved in cell wall biosynthesis
MKQNPTVVIVGGGNIVSGKEIVMLHLARGLRSAGCQVVFITSMWGGRSEFVSRLRADRFDYHRIRLGFISISLRLKPIIWTLDQLRYFPALVVGYLKAIRKIAPQVIIHTNWHHALLLIPFLDCRRDIYWSHEIIPIHHRTTPVFRMIANRVSAFVCVSDAAARGFALNGVSMSKILTIHNGFPLAAVVPPLNVGKTLRLGIVGQIGPWKGHDDLLEALCMVVQKGLSVLLRIFGSGQREYIDSLKRKMIDFGLSNSIEWCGFVDEQDKIFSEFDVCIVPSRFEDPLPTAAVEASGYGRPVIASRIGGLPEIVIHDETGLLVDSNNPQQLAQAIETFCLAPNLVRKMGHAARKRAKAEFSDARFVARFLHVVTDVTAGRDHFAFQ